jgi:hypothetical protein
MPLRQLHERKLCALNTAAQFEAAYDDYLKTVPDKGSSISKPEMCSLLGNEYKFREHMRGLGTVDEKKKDKKQPKSRKSTNKGNAHVECLLKLKRLYSPIVDSIHVGDAVILHRGGPIYERGSDIMVEENGVPRLYKVKQPVNSLHGGTIEARSSGADGSRQFDLRHVTFIRKSRQSEGGTVLQIDRSKGIVVLRATLTEELVVIRAANPRGPGGPTGPLGTPSRTLWILSR